MRFVLTVTVSLPLETTPPDVGVKLSVTVLEVEILMTSLIVALIVVLALLEAADPITGVAMTIAAAAAGMIRLIFICAFLISVFKRYAISIMLVCDIVNNV